jgi:hypothetical protein
MFIDLLQFKLITKIIAADFDFGSQMTVGFSQVPIFVLEPITGNNALNHDAPFCICAR